MRIGTLVRLVTFTVLSGAALIAQQPPPVAPVAVLDISGVWNRLDTEGGGSYTGISDAFLRAQLRPEFAAKLPPPPPPDAPPPVYNIREQFDPAPLLALRP